ncbi:helix-turn-helix domain-containing protein [Frankia sp. Cr1]|uniref:helix-turn-helix domain-containing protein n=1 Tax=Frankia sp. Cr1 TaxID=3073931 RepID=UPI002AD1FBD4|nr:helix-turn-helix domain-containing protein [Frankia sp. Cr1]
MSVALQRVVLCEIASFADADGTGAFPAVATLARLVGCSDRSIQRTLRALEQGGHITTITGGGRLSNWYTIAMPAASDRHVTAPPTACRPTSTCTKEIKSGSARAPETPSRCASVPTRTPPRSGPRGRSIPDDLRPLADALHARGLRAAYALDDHQADDVRTIIARVGIPAMVAAAYRAFQPARPAVWWSAWLGIWAGLYVPAQRQPGPVLPVAERGSAPIGPPAPGGVGATAVAATRELLARRAGRIPVGVPARSTRVGAGPLRPVLGDPGLNINN